MKQIQQPKEFKIEYFSQRMISITVPSLYYNKERCIILQTLLLMREAIKDVKIKTKQNFVTIKFDPEKLTQEKLLNILKFVLTNFSQKPQDTISDDSKIVVEQQREFNFAVEGMTCESCALFLNMMLSREWGITQINIDYATKHGMVKGYLSQEQVFDIINKQGFKAHESSSV